MASTLPVNLQLVRSVAAVTVTATDGVAALGCELYNRLAGMGKGSMDSTCVVDINCVGEDIWLHLTVTAEPGIAAGRLKALLVRRLEAALDNAMGLRNVVLDVVVEAQDLVMPIPAVSEHTAENLRPFPEGAQVAGYA